jgi:hypothetical protein
MTVIPTGGDPTVEAFLADAVVAPAVDHDGLQSAARYLAADHARIDM